MHGKTISSNDMKIDLVVSLRGETVSFNIWIHQLLNIREESSLQHYQFLFPLVIIAEAFNAIVQLYGHRR